MCAAVCKIVYHWIKSINQNLLNWNLQYRSTDVRFLNPYLFLFSLSVVKVERARGTCIYSFLVLVSPHVVRRFGVHCACFSVFWQQAIRSLFYDILSDISRRIFLIIFLASIGEFCRCFVWRLWVNYVDISSDVSRWMPLNIYLQSYSTDHNVPTVNRSRYNTLH